MLLGGLWHGANWTFVVWGALHGAYLWGEKIIQDLHKPSPVPMASVPSGEIGVLGVIPKEFKAKTFRNFMLAMVTFFFINVTWVFFRSPDFTSAWRMLTSMFSNVKNGTVLLPTLSIIKVSVIIIGIVIFHWLMRNTRILHVANKMPWWLLGLIWSAMVLLLIFSQESSSSFIYFQF